MRSVRRLLTGLLVLFGALAVMFVAAAVIYNQIAHYESRLTAWPDQSEYIEPREWNPDNPKRIRILSLDGGGMHGVVFLEVLKYLEQRSGRPIAELFDLFAGPSTGSIILAGLLIPDESGKPKNSVDDLMRAYSKFGKNVLNAPLYHKILTLNGLLGPRLFNHTKFVVENEMLGQTRFGELLRPAIVPVYSAERNGFVVFRNWSKPEANAYVGSLIAAATAVPTYFPAVQLIGHAGLEGLYTDALFIVNNPAHLAFLDVLERYPDADFVVVSMGISQLKKFTVQQGVGGGVVDWLEPIFSMVIHGQNDVVDQELERISKLEMPFTLDTIRISPELPLGLGAMDASQANIDGLSQVARDYIAKNKVQLERLLEKLTQTDTDTAVVGG